MTTTHSMCTWRAGCGESRTSGSEGGGEETTGRKANTAPRRRPYTRLRGNLSAADNPRDEAASDYRGADRN
jgi:hypothetical protein